MKENGLITKAKTELKQTPIPTQLRFINDICFAFMAIGVGDYIMLMFSSGYSICFLAMAITGLIGHVFCVTKYRRFAFKKLQESDEKYASKYIWYKEYMRA